MLRHALALLPPRQEQPLPSDLISSLIGCIANRPENLADTLRMASRSGSQTRSFRAIPASGDGAERYRVVCYKINVPSGPIPLLPLVASRCDGRGLVKVSFVEERASYRKVFTPEDIAQMGTVLDP